MHFALCSTYNYVLNFDFIETKIIYFSFIETMHAKIHFITVLTKHVFFFKIITNVFLKKLFFLIHNPKSYHNTKHTFNL
jgi:hypothetical protein